MESVISKYDETYKATWLELFFDLVFVAMVAQLTYHFSYHHHQVSDFIEVGIIGYMIFYAWWMTTVNRNLRQEEDVVDIFAVQLQMCLIMVMSLSLHGAFTDLSYLFFGSYVLSGVISLCMIRRLYYLHSDLRPQTLNIWWGYCAAYFCWSFCIILEPPYAYIAAGMGLVLQILTPLTKGEGNKITKLNMPHLLERLGLFLLMVMGEAVLVVALANTAAEALTWERLIFVLCGVLQLIGLWWLYFPYATHCVKGLRSRWTTLMLNAYGFFFGSLVTTAAGIKTVLLYPMAGMEEMWLYFFGLWLQVVSFNVIRTTLTHSVRDTLFSSLGFTLLLFFVGVMTVLYEVPAIRVIPVLTVVFIFYVIWDYWSHFRDRKRHLMQPIVESVKLDTPE